MRVPMWAYIDHLKEIAVCRVAKVGKFIRRSSIGGKAKKVEG